MPTKPPQPWVISTSFSAGIDLGDLAADMDVDVLGILDRIDLAPAEQQPPVLRLAEIAHDEAGIVDRLAARQHRAVGAERHGRADERADRHDVRGAHRLEVAAIGVDGDQALVGGDRARRRRHLHLAAAATRCRSRLVFSNRCAPASAATRAVPITSFSGWMWPVPVSRVPPK